MDLSVAWNGSAMSRPLVMRLKHDLLAEIYGPVCCLEWLRNEQTCCVIRVKYALLTETYGPVCCLEWLCNEQTSCNCSENFMDLPVAWTRRNFWTCLLLGMAL